MKFPNEDREYRTARNALLKEEKALRRQVEKVAALRRGLPAGGEVPQEYVFEGEEGEVKLSALFGQRDTLLAYSFMYGPKMKAACPSCTSIIDVLDRSATHVGRRASLVVIARSPLERILAFARERGWKNLRLLSSAGSTYNRDYGAETPEGGQMPMMNVFVRRAGKVRHHWGSELLYAETEPGQDPRHADCFWPLWNLLDLTPEGRGDFYPKLAY